MRPCTAYSDLGSVGITPNIKHTVGATVDGQKFIGEGRSKKEARKKVATDVLLKLFDWKPSDKE
jgi:dsRNA-specific ribonuclease